MMENARLVETFGVLARTIETIVPEAELAAKLERGRPLRLKLGIDPTSPTIHIGNAVQLWLLRHLQDQGHLPVLILR
jgi:tyrosyl-tRNA synthetase